MGERATYQIHIEGCDAAAGVGYAAVGEQFTGHVSITPREDIKLKRLSVQLVWKAHGKGDPEESVVSESETETSTLRTGHVVEVPFCFGIPDQGPITYDGDCVKLEWEIRLALDIPWGIDDQASFPVLVMARPHG